MQPMSKRIGNTRNKVSSAACQKDVHRCYTRTITGGALLCKDEFEKGEFGERCLDASEGTTTGDKYTRHFAMTDIRVLPGLT